MKTHFLIPIVLLLLCSRAFAANPAFQDFYGTNGIVIRTNGNKVQVDGSALASTNLINPTIGYIPYKSNIAAFGDSPLYRIDTNRIGFVDTNSFLFHNIANGNLGIGQLALNAQGSAGDNTVIGWQSATNPTAASGNTFVGSSVAPLLGSGDENTGVGWFSLQSVTNGERNVAVGGSALISLASGQRNVGVGYDALASTRSSDNTGIGYSAGASVNQGIENTFVGFFADTSVSGARNSTAIGANSLVTSSNQMVFGSGVSNYQFRGVDYVYPGAQGASDTFLKNNGAGALEWTTNLHSLNVTNLTVVNNFTGKGDVFVTNLFLGGANVRTNQYTTNISFTPVLGSLFFGGTVGSDMTNGSRTGMEYIPARHSFRVGSLGTAASVSNYWDSTNVGVGSFAQGSNVLGVGFYSAVHGIANQIRTNSTASSVMGGSNNIILTNAFSAHIGGGYNNSIGDNHITGFIGGGNNNALDTLSLGSASASVIAGGFNNRVRVHNSAIVGGSGNDVQTTSGFIGAGANNLVRDGDFIVIVGGQQNTADGDWSFIGGGNLNNIHANATGADALTSAIVGGNANAIGSGGTAGSDYAFIGGGRSNLVMDVADYCTIGGGSFNQTGGGGNAVQGNFIGGGFNNLTDDQIDFAVIGGGKQNTVSGDFGAILGGTSNRTTVAFGYAVGSFITNSTTKSVEVGWGSEGGNNRKLRVDANGAKVMTYGGAAAVGGTILVTNTVVFSAGAAETNLQVVTIGANVLTNNQERILFRASGRFAATSNTKTIKVVYGSETIFDSTAGVANTGAWVLDGEIIRTGNTSQSCNVDFNGGTNVVFVRTSSLDAAQTNGIATVLKITGTAAGDGDLTNRSFTVEWRPAP